jgi:alginate O-acetyltransferase complex protein AlgI
LDLISTQALLFVAAVVAVLAVPQPAVSRRALLLVANFAFLYLFDPLAPALFLGVSLAAYFVARLAARGVHGVTLFMLCVPLLAPLFLPKLPIFSGAGETASVGNVVGVRLAFFIGASYFTLRALHCVLDARRKGELHLGLFDFLVYNSFFPTMVAGPIERADHFKQTYDKLGRPDAEDIREGFTRLFTGLLKKVVLGGIALSWAEPITNFAQSQGGLSAGSAWIALYAIALYAWFDFAGYSDMAIGVGRLMGIRLAENFENPYMRTSIAEFWRGWHISLSFWIRDYLFIPMAGRSASAWRPHLAALGSMTLCGLWHGPNLGWGLWGLMHGLGLSVHQAWSARLRKNFRLKKRLANSRIARVLAILLTFHFVALTWTLVSIDTTRIGPTLDYLAVLFGLG